VACACVVYCCAGVGNAMFCSNARVQIQHDALKVMAQYGTSLCYWRTMAGWQVSH
jgi:hypothetical protein